MKQCSVKNCNKQHHAKGYCRNHYQADYRHGNPNYKARQRPSKWEGVQCSAAECDRDVYSKGLCAKHYTSDLRLRTIGIPK